VAAALARAHRAAQASGLGASSSCRLLVNGAPGSLQWFDAAADAVADQSLEVSKRVLHTYGASLGCLVVWFD